MSVQTALDNIYLRPTSQWAHTELSFEYHGAYLASRLKLPQENADLLRQAYDRFQVDFIWNDNNGIIDWEKHGRVTDMGHAAYALDGSDQHGNQESPFHSDEEVWSFDAVEEYGLPDFDEQVSAYEDELQTLRAAYPNQLIPGGYYRTLVSGALATFGWDRLLTALSDPGKMEKVFDSFFRRTLFHMEAWAKTSAEVVIQHDDFVWTSGPFMKPDLYRKMLIPHYAELWKPLHDAGKKVLFCSDGNFTMFADDIAEAGADGFIFEPCHDFDFMVDRFGQSHCLVGSFVDCRDLTFKRWEQVQSDLDRTFDRLTNCKGAIVTVGNHLAPNIPEVILDRYFNYLLSHLKH